MDSFKNLTIDEKMDQMKEDYNTEWWRPSKIDNYDIKNKLLRVGCRPLKRKYIKCRQVMELPEDYKKCQDLNKELNDCYEMLYTVYYNTKRDEVINKKY
jgi:hypothetical protein